MADDTLLAFVFPAVDRKKVTAAFDGGRIASGGVMLALFNAQYDERCFQPIHVYDTATSRPVAVLLRSGKTPSGTEIRSHLRRLVRRVTVLHTPTHHLCNAASNSTGAVEQNAPAFSMGDSTAPIETVQRQGKKE